MLATRSHNAGVAHLLHPDRGRGHQSKRELIGVGTGGRLTDDIPAATPRGHGFATPWRLSLSLGALYVAMMFVFAWIYTNSGQGAFYDANLQREPTHFADEQQVDNLLSEAVRTNASRHVWTVTLHAASGPVPTEVELEPESIRATGVGGADELPRWTVSGEFASVPRAKLALAATFDVQVQVQAEDVSSIQPAHGTQPVAVYTVVRSAPQTSFADNPPMEILFPTPKWAGISGSDAGSVPATQKLREVVTAYLGALAGDPSSQSGEFARMLYFSATTATTLGLGDITPVTDEARLLVTLETILEVVLVGLFLASLSPRRRGPASD
jgi:hypothetical protein